MKDTCDTCGFLSDEPLQITYHQLEKNYCSFECAIAQLAPECSRCKCKVIGHGAYGRNGEIYCSHHCAQLVVAAR